MLNLLAFDLGASNGRAILGQLDNGVITLRELHRFENNCQERSGRMCWDIEHLYKELLEGFRAYAKLDIGSLDCFGIDTWAVDYGLLDANGRLLGWPRAYRGAEDRDAEAVWERIDYPTLFARTGIANLNFNTVYQLYRRKTENDPELAEATTMLMIPDLIGYMLTGVARTEYTNATTTMLYSAELQDWDRQIIRTLELPEKIFTEVDRAGTLRGELKQEIAVSVGLNQVPFAAVGTHDTASAVAAIPGEGDFAFCSCGTWSLVGIETDHALLNAEAREANFSNEGTVQGGFRPLKNIMGLWIIQECRREWLHGGMDLSWNDIVREAEQAEPFRSVIDPDDGPFFSAGGMTEKIRNACRKTGQPEPDTVGQIARCVYESLALKYRWAVEWLEELGGKPLDSLCITGGGIQNRLLMQMAADAAGRRVIAGPADGAALGNLLMQAVALGAVKNLKELREIVRRSERPEIYEPAQTEEWKEAYQRLLKIMNTDHQD